MEKETDTDKILQAIANLAETVDEVQGAMAHMVTKDELHAAFAALRTEDIDPMKKDIAAIKEDVQKIRTTFAPRIEYDDRLTAIEQKIGIPSPH